MIAPSRKGIIATAIAQKDNPQVDVVMADQAAFQQGIQQGIFENRIPVPAAEPFFAEPAGPAAEQVDVNHEWIELVEPDPLLMPWR